MLEHVCRMCDVSGAELARVFDAIGTQARVAVHFHPDRPCATGTSVAERLLAEGLYRNQFETRISNGGLSAHPGGRRDACERVLFGGAYHAANVGAAERPKYGALELLRRPEGPSPRFGSCYLVLAPHVAQRCTFTYLDSHEDPAARGTHGALEDIVASLLREAFFGDMALGEHGVSAPTLVRRLQAELIPQRSVGSSAAPVRNLNHYVEAQIHGDLDLRADVETLVVDPSFQGTEIGELLEACCRHYGVRLERHHGFVLPPAEVPRDFRGPTMPSLASRVARQGVVHAAAIGMAAAELHRDPGAYGDRGSFDEVLQELKLLWHVLVRYGHV